MMEKIKKIIKEKLNNTIFYAIARNLKERIIDSRPKKSYSQVGEDLILNFFLKGKRNGFYVDIGAYHPRALNNTYLFYIRGWSGINIEPNPDRFQLFQKNRKRDINVNIGIGKEKTELDFYVFDAETLSTFSQELAERYKILGHRIKTIQKVNISPLHQVLSEYAQKKHIDFMSIDTEGHDMIVLETNDWQRHRPSFIVLETVEYAREAWGRKINDIYDPFFEKIGYVKIADTYINTIYADKANF